MFCLNSNQITAPLIFKCYGKFLCENSIKSSVKSSAILNFRDSKLKNFPYKVSHLQRSTRASELQFQPSQPKRASCGPVQIESNCQDTIKSQTLVVMEEIAINSTYKNYEEGKSNFNYIFIHKRRNILDTCSLIDLRMMNRQRWILENRNLHFIYIISFFMVIHKICKS